MAELPIPSWTDLIDLGFVTALLWVGIGAVRRTRARPALLGIALLVAIYAIARVVGLQLTATLFQGFFAIVVIVLVVIFQEDLRRLFEQLGSWRARRPRVVAASSELDVIVRAVAQMAANRCGALIVMPGDEPLDRHLDGGIVLGGRVTEPLLLSLFDASSPGHDGAVLIRDGSVERFAVHLPLSSNHEALGPGGTRHAAALGLSERCDATCIVVSEERGTISVAHDGALRVLARPEDLLNEPSLVPPAPDEGVMLRWSPATIRDLGLAFAGAAVLWLLLVAGDVAIERPFSARVELTNLPPDLELESIEPMEVQVVLRGARRDLLLADPEAIEVRLDTYLARLGRRTFQLSPGNVRRPDELSIVRIEPDQVRLSFAPRPNAAVREGSP